MSEKYCISCGKTMIGIYCRFNEDTETWFCFCLDCAVVFDKQQDQKSLEKWK